VINHQHFPVEPWAIRETELDLEVLAQTESIFALANGHLGLRGNLDEGEPRALSGTYLNGLYESFPIAYGEGGYGFAEDGQSVINVTDGKLIRLLVEDEPLDIHRGSLESHERVLDLKTGILKRELVWASDAGREVRVSSRRLVSLKNRSVAAISYEVEALEEPLRVAVQSNLIANETERVGGSDPRSGKALGAVLEGQLHTKDRLRVVLAHRTRSSDLSLAAGMEHVIDSEDEPLTRTEAEPDLGRVTISARLTPGKPLRVVKLLAYHWSSVQSIEWLRDQVDASLENAVAESFDGLAESQRGILTEFWSRGNIEIDGDPEIQQALRFAQFQLLQASARAERQPIAAKGLTGPGYDGHAFWDTEGFVLVPLTHIAPDAVRDALHWRHSTLDAARARAEQLGLKGAAFPWRTIHGEECSGYWPAGTAAFHVNAGVAIAVSRYIRTTGDEQFEREAGLEILVETARLWTSLGHFDRHGSFHIAGVTGPDEYSAVADDNVYTNLAAQRNLREAAKSATQHADRAERLGVVPNEIAEWRAAAEEMYVPYDPELEVHPQSQGFTRHERWDFEGTPAERYPLLLHYPYFDLYRKQVVKQADLVLAMFVCGEAFTPEEKLRNFDYYEALTVRDSSLSACIQAVGAAEVGHLDLAYDYLAEAALMDLYDLEHNVLDGVHIASLAGALIATTAGLAGMRPADDGIAFAPRLPDGIERLAFPVSARGSRLDLEVVREQATYTWAEGADPLPVTHFGEPVKLRAGEPVAMPIPDPPRLEPPAQPAGRAPKRRGG
jgi:alpha,alpha-trehalose phosphorylase